MGIQGIHTLGDLASFLNYPDNQQGDFIAVSIRTNMPPDADSRYDAFAHSMGVASSLFRGYFLDGSGNTVMLLHDDIISDESLLPQALAALNALDAALANQEMFAETFPDLNLNEVVQFRNNFVSQNNLQEMGYQEFELENFPSVSAAENIDLNDPYAFMSSDVAIRDVLAGLQGVVVVGEGASAAATVLSDEKAMQKAAPEKGSAFTAP